MEKIRNNLAGIDIGAKKGFYRSGGSTGSKPFDVY
jgi:hypothetical protein